MQRRRAIQLAGLAAAAVRSSAAPAVREKFLGVWKLVSYDSHPQDGPIRQIYGPNPIGRITYDKAGHMSAFLMRPGRKPAQNPRAATVEELREIQSGFVAYFGTFDVDEAAKTVIHHVTGALNPAWPGTDLRRTYEFSGDKLTLTAASGTGKIVLVWQKESD
jgi:hypothetical protein